tara:strand:- start:5956 stop:7218 length:1263 start_codon:yes stop_codon:yes gene_type:complete
VKALFKREYLPMKILMFGWEFPPHNSGGLGVACEGLTMALAKEGADIDFVLPKKVPLKAEHLNFIFADGEVSDESFTKALLNAYINDAEYRDAFSKLTEEEQKRYGNTLFHQVNQYAKEAKEIAKEQDFDVIHAHDWLTFCAGVNAKKETGKPLVVHIHNTVFDRYSGLGVMGSEYEIEKEGLQKADKIIAVSEYTRNKVIQHYGIKPEKVEVVHNGVQEEKINAKKLENDLNEFKKHGFKIVSFLGRITLQKGPDYFIRAAKKVTDTYKKNVLFLMTGSGDMERQMMKEASYMGLSDKVIFTGFLRGEDQKKIFHLSDLFVMPSVSEPFGIVPLEALLQDTPVLISKQSGVSEVLQHALKVDFWDTDEMANKIISTLEHPPLGKHLAENGKQEAKLLSWKKAAQKCMVLYENLTGPSLA